MTFTPKQLKDGTATSHGIDEQEIQVALASTDDNQLAVFGFNGTFMYPTCIPHNLQ